MIILVVDTTLYLVFSQHMRQSSYVLSPFNLRLPTLVLVNGEDLTPYRADSKRILAVLRRFGTVERCLDSKPSFVVRRQQQNRYQVCRGWEAFHIKLEPSRCVPTVNAYSGWHETEWVVWNLSMNVQVGLFRKNQHLFCQSNKNEWLELPTMSGSSIIT